MLLHYHDFSLTMHACRWIQDQHANHGSENWRNGVEEYLKYSKEIQTKFPVAVDKQSPADTGGDFCLTIYSKMSVLSKRQQAAADLTDHCVSCVM